MHCELILQLRVPTSSGVALAVGLGVGVGLGAGELQIGVDVPDKHPAKIVPIAHVLLHGGGPDEIVVH